MVRVEVIRKRLNNRNTLVHDYVDIDRGIVYEALQHGLEDLEALERIFAQFL